MTRKEAREWLLDHIPSKTIMPEAYWAYRTAIDALFPVSREQVEKVWEKCQHSDACVTCKVCVRGRYQQANFCPVCGAPMTDEAVSIVIERLEALKGV